MHVPQNTLLFAERPSVRQKRNVVGMCLNVLHNGEKACHENLEQSRRENSVHSRFSDLEAVFIAVASVYTFPNFSRFCMRGKSDEHFQNGGRFYPVFKRAHPTIPSIQPATPLILIFG